MRGAPGQGVQRRVRGRAGWCECRIKESSIKRARWSERNAHESFQLSRRLRKDHHRSEGGGEQKSVTDHR